MVNKKKNRGFGGHGWMSMEEGRQVLNRTLFGGHPLEAESPRNETTTIVAQAAQQSWSQDKAVQIASFYGYFSRRIPSSPWIEKANVPLTPEVADLLTPY